MENNHQGAFATERYTHILIKALDDSIQTERQRNPIHKDIKAEFAKEDQLTRQKILREKLAELKINLVILRNLGLKIEDIAKLIAT